MEKASLYSNWWIDQWVERYSLLTLFVHDDDFVREVKKGLLYSEMGDSQHSIVCATVRCAEEILSNGLERLVGEREKARGSFNSEELCRLCSSLVLAQSSTILAIISSILSRYKFNTRIVSEAVASSSGVRSAAAMLDKPKQSFCEVFAGEHGRMLCTTQGVVRGHILLQERPYAYVVATSCGCREGPLLVEHLSLACAIRNSRENNAAYFSRFMQSFTSGLNLPALEPTRGPDVDVRTIPKSETAPPGGDTGLWSTREQLRMALQAAILCLYQANTEYNAQYGPVKDLTASVAELGLGSQGSLRSNSPGKGGIRKRSPSKLRGKDSDSVPVDMKRVWKERLFGGAWLLMQILSRLPQNTHAVSRVVTMPSRGKAGGGDSSAAREVQQVRLGYAVFLTASAINHCCKPNATIRYTMPDSDKSTSDTGSSVLDCLRDVCIEIVSTESIPRHNSSSAAMASTGGAYDNPGEVTVSYGPLQGPHSVEQRQSILQRQYLFTCTCPACVSDLHSLLRLKTAASDAHMRSNLTAARQAMEGSKGASALDRLDQVMGTTLGQVEAATQSAVQRTQILSAPERDTRYLSSRLTSLKAQLAQLNSLFTDVLHHARQQGGGGQRYDTILLNSFEVKKLKPVEEALEQLQRVYFPPTPVLQDRLKRMDDCTDGAADAASTYALDPLYPDFSAAYCSYLDMAGHLCALQEQYLAAARRIHTAIVLMLDSRLYPASDVVVGRERVKLAGLLMSCGHHAACAAQVKCALSILKPVVSADDPDLEEAKHIYAFCLRQL